MVHMIRDTNADEKDIDIREITFRYDRIKDGELLKKIEELIKNNQNLCTNCTHHKIVGCLGGYRASECEIYGNLEDWDNPYHDGDGSKCEDYDRLNR